MYLDREYGNSDHTAFDSWLTFRCYANFFLYRQ